MLNHANRVRSGVVDTFDMSMFHLMLTGVALEAISQDRIGGIL